MNLEQKKTRNEILTAKEEEVKKAPKPAYIYDMIDWCEKMKTEDEPIYAEDYETLQDVAMNTLLHRINQAPKGKNWSESVKATVNEHVSRLRQINDEKIKKLEDELLAAQKTKETFKLKELQDKIDQARLFGTRIMDTYKIINQKKAA